MTVAELIEFLKDCDPDTLVISDGGCCGDYELVNPYVVPTEDDEDDYSRYWDGSKFHFMRPGMVIL